MSLRPKAVYEARARITKALAHPTRLLLLDALGEKNLCVCEMTELVGADQSTISKHLAILKDAGLVGVEKKGSMSVFSLKCRCLDGFLTCLESVMRDNVRAQQALVEIQ